MARPRPETGPPPAVRRIGGAWADPPRRSPSLTAPGRFRFLNDERAPTGWDDPAIPKLWRYNLHYFDDLNAEQAGRRMSWHLPLIAQWIAGNAPGTGTGWEPYPTSLRIVNWIRFALGGGTLSPEALHSLAVQARWLCRRIEWHILGNHLLANAKALVFAGRFFSGAEADGWRTRGEAILAAQLPEQILPDGAHFELSPMYHALVLEDLLDLVNLGRAMGGGPVPPELVTAASRMLEWQRGHLHPDGEIAFFNDAAFGIAPRPADLAAYAQRLGIGLPAGGTAEAPRSGYERVAFGPLLALIDIAAIGPDYLPGHAHADTLSFEVSFAGQRLLVNSGTSEYGDGPERQRQRGTAAHNTLVIDGADSSEVWAGFRVARRARVRDVLRRPAPTPGEPVNIAASHDGYRRLPGRPIHRREWHFEGDRLTVTDLVTGRFRRAEAWFHFHPDVRVAPRPGGFEARLPRGGVVLFEFIGGEARLQPGTWHPEFGRTVANVALVVHLSGSSLATILSW